MLAICISTRSREEFAKPTYDRIKSQTYSGICIPIIIDGSDTPSTHWQQGSVIYKHIPKIILGASRNLAIDTALKQTNAEFICLWDDDDEYFPTHLEKSVNALNQNPHAVAVGQSKTLMLFSDTQELWQLGPYDKYHALEPSLVFRRSWLEDSQHRCDPNDILGSARQILCNWSAPIVQIEPTYIHIAHNRNTFDKTQIRRNPKRFGAKQLSYRQVLKLRTNSDKEHLLSRPSRTRDACATGQSPE